MNLDVDMTLTPAAAGAARATAAIVPGKRGPKDVTPAGVVLLFMGEGRTVRALLSPQEAQMLGMMLVTCACVAEGGPPPSVATPSNGGS